MTALLEMAKRFGVDLASHYSSNLGAIAAGVASGLTVFLFIYAILHIIMRFRSRDISRLGGMAQTSPILVIFTPILNRLAFVANYTSTAGHRGWVAGILRRADMMEELSVDLVETLKVFCALMTAVCMAAIMLLLGYVPSAAGIVVFAVSAFFLPDLLLLTRANERVAKMGQALPFFLDLMTVSAESGLAFQQSIKNVVDNCSRGWRDDRREDSVGERALAEEFERIAADMRVGHSMTDALTASMRRVEIDEYKAFGSAMLQADRLGTPSVDTLRQQAKELRMKLTARAEAKAAKAPVKILFPMILFIFPVTAWVIVGPVLLTIYYGGY